MKKKFPGFKSNTERKKNVSVSAHYSKRASKIYLNCVGFIISYSLQLAGFETHPPPSLLSQPRISKKNRLWLTTHSYLQNMLSQPSLTKWKSETDDWKTEFSKGFKYSLSFLFNMLNSTSKNIYLSSFDDWNTFKPCLTKQLWNIFFSFKVKELWVSRFLLRSAKCFMHLLWVPIFSLRYFFCYDWRL